jgi:hypothetical protein
MQRGSRKHILDWTSLANFPAEFIELINLPECIFAHPPMWQPQGHDKPDEICLEDKGGKFVTGVDCWKDLASWWLIHSRGANKPNWDLVVSCNLANVPGLVLVEAKAHERELDWGGKRISPGGSANSAANHKRIGHSIAEASSALDRIIPGVHLSRDSHYQLANRVAYSWKLASMGVPVLLMYLGFTGDNCIADVGVPLQDKEHWQSVMCSYTQGVLPEGFLDQWLSCGKAQMRMIVRSRAVLEQSPYAKIG